MNLPRPFFHLLTALCCAVLLCAQATGVARGYLCACSGTMEWSAQNHCHGVHDGSCHDATVTAVDHQESNDLGERRDHQQVRDALDLLLATTVNAPAVVPIVMVLFGEQFGVPATDPAVLRSVMRVSDEASPPGVFVARTVVLLI